MSEEPEGPTRPDSIEFLKIKQPGRPVVLQWHPPAGEPAGFVVYATENRLPAQMAPQLFAGKMRQFIDEVKLPADATEYRTARAESFYGVVWFDVDDNYNVVDGLPEPAELQEVFVDINTFSATQTRTYLRAKFLPPPLPMRDTAVEVWARDIEPNTAALMRMAEGHEKPDFSLKPDGDGFIDTVAEEGWRQYYVAVAVGKDGNRRPMNLEMGGFLRLEEPIYLERNGKRKCQELMEKIRDQIELELQRASVGAADIKAMLERADNLAPFNPMVKRLKQRAMERYGDEW